MKKIFCLFFVLLLILTPVAWGMDLIDINSASSKELERIIGIGPVLAQRIIEARPFSSLDDLIKIEGIGEVTLKKIKDQGLAGLARVNPETLPAKIPELKPVSEQALLPAAPIKAPEQKLSEVGPQITEKGAADIEEKVLNLLPREINNRSSLPLLIAFVVAIFSAGITLFLKKINKN